MSSLLKSVIESAINKEGVIEVAKRSEVYIYTKDEAKREQKYWGEDDSSKEFDFSKYPLWVIAEGASVGFDSFSDLFEYLLDLGFSLEELLG